MTRFDPRKPQIARNVPCIDDNESEALFGGNFWKRKENFRVMPDILIRIMCVTDRQTRIILSESHSVRHSC